MTVIVDVPVETGEDMETEQFGQIPENVILTTGTTATFEEVAVKYVAEHNSVFPLVIVKLEETVTFCGPSKSEILVIFTPRAMKKPNGIKTCALIPIVEKITKRKIILFFRRWTQLFLNE